MYNINKEKTSTFNCHECVQFGTFVVSFLKVLKSVHVCTACMVNIFYWMELFSNNMSDFIKMLFQTFVSNL